MTGETDTASADAATRRAVIDIGSNTVRLVIYGGAPRAPVALLNEKAVARLGCDLRRTGTIPAAAMETALGALRRFRRILDDLEVSRVDVLATAAARLAGNGPDFLDRVREVGFDPVLLSGEREARTSAMGVIGAFPGARGVVADLGGGSIELVEIADGACRHGVSLPIGTLLLPDLRAEGPAAFRRRIVRALAGEDWAHAIDAPLYMVGGTWRALAGLAMREAGHPLTDPHGFELDGRDALALARRVRRMKPARIAAEGIDPMRAELLPDACALLHVLLGKLEPARLVFSAWGLREGWLYDRLDAAAKAQDPLLSGIASFAAPRGGSPMLAAQIAGWTVDALPRGGGGPERVRLAATMLALASMQVEPNLRLRQVIDWALYKRWIGLSGEGRAMMAAALSANCGRCDLPRTLARLASRARLEEALCWGLAIRLARRLGGGSVRSLRNSALGIRGKRLVLYLGESHADLWAEHVETDLDALARSLGLKPAMTVVPEGRLPGKNGAGAQTRTRRIEA